VILELVYIIRKEGDNVEGKVIEKLYDMIKNKEDAALVTIVNSTRGTPRGEGSMMLVNELGELVEGTIGGGKIEIQAMEDSKELIKRGLSKNIKYELREDGLGMVCGGNVEVFVKVFKKRDELLIVGGGHIANKLSKLAKILGYYVVVVDDRPELVNKETYPEADELLVGNMEEELGKYIIKDTSNIVIVTHGHKHDQISLERVMRSEARYIGMIGSKTKVKHCFNNMKEKGYGEEELSRVYSPIGLNIGGETPEEISLSILAEIQAVKYEKESGSLKIKL
jgi:xanthine dehydrogenase accessory factor